MVVLPSAAAEKVNANTSNTPWEAASTVEPTDTSSSSSEDAFLLEAGSVRPQSGEEEVAPSQGKAPMGRWSDLLDDSAGIHALAHSPELCEEPIGEEEEEDYEGFQDEMGETGGKAKRRTRRRRRNKKGTSEAGTPATVASAHHGRSPCSGLSTPSCDMMEAGEFFSTYPHTPSKMYAGFQCSSPMACLSSPANARSANGRNVVTCFDILGQELSLSPKTGAMHASGMATAPRFAPAVPTCTLKAFAEPSTPTSRQDYVEAGARAPSHAAPNGAQWYGAASSPMGATMNHWVASPMAQSPPMDNRQALMSMLGVHHNSCTQDLAEQLKAVAPETYED